MKGKNKKGKKQPKEKKEKKESFYSYIAPSEEQIYELKTSIKKNIMIIGIITFITIMIFFQYRYELKMDQRYNNNNEDEDYYSILGLEPGASINDIRKAYKKLSKIWHPDKHPNCINCKEKFLQITKAHESLIKNNENSSLKNSLFTSHPIILTSKNYHKLVELSDDFWVILVFENRPSDVVSIFDEISNRFKSIIKFGIIDIIKEDELTTYLPFSFKYPPSIFTHLTGIDDEIYQNIDRINVIDFMRFIEDVYKSKISLIDKYKLRNLYNLKGKLIKKNDIDIKKDLDLQFFIFSSKNVIDLVAKDFQKKYENCQVYQNELEFYKDALDIFKAKNNEKIFISFNDISKEDNKTLIKEIMPLPIQIGLKDDMTQKLQIAFEIGKRITIPKIYKNNYMKHCTSKIELIENQINNENNNNNNYEDDKNNNIDICIIELNDKNDKYNKNNNDINIAFYKSIIYNFEKNLEKKNNEETTITINYGYINLEDNKNLLDLYNSYLKSFENQFNKLGKKYLIIDQSNEKFLFKSFNDSDTAEKYLKHISDIDFYEDISMAFQYFSDFNIREINTLFNIHKVFSLKQIFFMSLYSQTKASYIFMYVLIYFSSIYILKYYANKAFKFTVYSFIFSLISHFTLFFFQYFWNE
jgi:hypothetical protein